MNEGLLKKRRIETLGIQFSFKRKRDNVLKKKRSKSKRTLERVEARKPARFFFSRLQVHVLTSLSVASAPSSASASFTSSNSSEPDASWSMREKMARALRCVLEGQHTHTQKRERQKGKEV